MKTTHTTDARFANLGMAKRIWTISAIHGEIARLCDLHDLMFNHITPGDRVVYTGNYIGYGTNSSDVIDEILAFRRAAIAKPGMIPSDIIYLRGAQEEMWQKLLQLQFAPDPLKALTWMLGNGLSNTLYAYGLSPHDGIEACGQGMIGVSNWTKTIRTKIRARAGHDMFATQLVRAAISDQTTDYPMLFVNSGIDPEKPLEKQKDSFWWAHSKFDKFDAPYLPFEKVIRGHDPEHNGVQHNCIKATIDGGCGFGGELVCSVFAQTGEVIDQIAC